MVSNFYIDESGNTGDVLSTGENFRFNGQPIFSLACIGVDDIAKMDDFISIMRSKYQIQGSELKSKNIYRTKPKFFVDLVNYLSKEGIPIFIEVVDKKYYIAMNIVNCHVMAAYSSPPAKSESQLARNQCADFIYYNAPNTVFDKFISACKTPSHETLIEAFTEILDFANSLCFVTDFSEFFLKMIEMSIDDYIKLSVDNEDAPYLKFLPYPDTSKMNKPIWMLPNLTSFTNLYARINLYLNEDISGTIIHHDSQAQFDGIIDNNKNLLEELDMENAIVTQTAKYSFTGSASLKFVESQGYIPIQVADILAGMAMRYLHEKIEGTQSNLDIVTAYDQILRTSNSHCGLGINLVTTAKIHYELNF